MSTVIIINGGNAARAAMRLDELSSGHMMQDQIKRAAKLLHDFEQAADALCRECSGVPKLTEDGGD